MAIAGFIIMAVGVFLILVGVYVSMKDWKRKQEAEAGKGAEALALDKTIGALAKLADALKGHQLGMQLILVGIVVILVGGVIGTLGAV
jgi:uncharacterized membrane protein